MASATVRISADAHRALRTVAAEKGTTLQGAIDELLDAYHRARYFEELNGGYAALTADPEAWRDYKDEIASIDGTLMDGLDPDEVWSEDGTILNRPQNA